MKACFNIHEIERVEQSITDIGLKKTAIAKRLNVSKNVFSHMLAGRRMVSNEERETIRVVLNISKDVLKDIAQ
jgi:plasmid maintenance system antidote protein VapI